MPSDLLALNNQSHELLVGWAALLLLLRCCRLLYAFSNNSVWLLRDTAGGQLSGAPTHNKSRMVATEWPF